MSRADGGPEPRQERSAGRRRAPARSPRAPRRQAPASRHARPRPPRPDSAANSTGRQSAVRIAQTRPVPAREGPVRRTYSVPGPAGIHSIQVRDRCRAPARARQARPAARPHPQPAAILRDGRRRIADMGGQVQRRIGERTHPAAAQGRQGPHGCGGRPLRGEPRRSRLHSADASVAGILAQGGEQRAQSPAAPGFAKVSRLPVRG